MFKASLKEKLMNIFDFDKVTFDRPSESMEQEGVFIEVEKAKCKVVDAKQIAHVTGKIHVFANIDKLPYGYFTKQIADADADDTSGLVFFDFEENKGTFRNIAERSLGFVYLFDSQYDPALGTINEINLSIAEAE
jgi:hypothetical protein